MSLSLSPSELDFLILMYKKEKNKTHADWINIILLSHKGYSGVEISSILNMDQDTESKWRSRYLERTDDRSWLKDNYKPYTGKLPCQFISMPRRCVEVFLVGCKKELLAFLQDSFSVSYTLSGLNKLLHRIGLSHQTIHKLPGRCPVDQQRAWIVQFEKYPARYGSTNRSYPVYGQRSPHS
jgi:transposase